MENVPAVGSVYETAVVDGAVGSVTVLETFVSS